MRQRKGHRKPKAEARTLELEIMGLGASGDGWAEVSGERIYLPKTWAGDRVRARVQGQKGEVLERLSDGPGRVSSPCPHFDSCGGCQLQHIDEDAYRNHKREGLIHPLQRAGLEVPDLVAHWCPTGSRRRATLHARGRKQSVILGYHAPGSHKLTDISSCLVMHRDLEAALPALRGLLQGLLPPGEEAEVGLTLFENGIEVSLRVDDEWFEENRLAILSALGAAADRLKLTGITVNDEPALRVQEPLTHFETFAVSPPHDAFLQPSKEGEEILTQYAVDWRPEKGATRAVDLFAGCGTYSLPLSVHMEVTAYESENAQVEALLAACNKNMIANVKGIRRDLFRDPLSATELRKTDYAVLNPPRAGARDQALELSKSEVPVVTYVSCNPGTFARDAAALVAGGYTLTRLALIDQFVYSSHAECAARFERLS